MDKWIYDLETYQNYFIAGFKSVDVDEFVYFESNQLPALVDFVDDDKVLIGFNNRKFDDPILKAIINNIVKSDLKIHQLANAIINSDDKFGNSNISKLTYNQSTPFTSCDLMEIRQTNGSLKIEEIRLKLPHIQDLPYEPTVELTDDQKFEVKQYLRNDLLATEALFNANTNTYNVRAELENRYSKLNSASYQLSDSKITEKVFGIEYERLTGIPKYNLTPPAINTFDPHKIIESDVVFKTPENIEAFEKLKAIMTFKFEAREEVKRVFDGITFYAGGHPIELGIGGLHTIIHAGSYEGNLVDIDVGSYYPNLLRKYGRSPRHLRSDWLEILNDMTDTRLDAKHSGDKSTADVLKIIINSAFGKLMDDYSAFRDMELGLRVTINGQLYLIMLMEALGMLGVEIISGNTDGILVCEDNNMRLIKAVVDKWCATFALSMDYNHYDKCVCNNVNDYAVAKDGKWVKRKGSFFNASSVSVPGIIKDAILHHFESGELVDDYIKQCDDIHKFVYGKQVNVKDVKVFHGETLTQKTNRFYKSTTGKNLYYIKDDKKHIVADGTSVTVCNNLNDTFPADIDYEYYISVANEKIRSIKIGKAASGSTKEVLQKSFKKFQSRGFVVTPKGTVKKPKKNIPETYNEAVVNYWREAVYDEVDFEDYTGLGAYTGAEYGILAVDVDYPDKATEKGLYERLNKNTCVQWHGDRKPEDVLAGKSKGTLIYKCSKDLYNTTGAKFLEEFGF